jgi:DNA repair photolyase
MAGLGKFSVPPFCKCPNYATHGIRFTYQPFYDCTHFCPFCYAQYGYRWNFWAKKSDTKIAVTEEEVKRDYLKLKPRSQIEASSSCDPFDLHYESKHEITKKMLENVFNLRDDIAFTWITKSHIIGKYCDILPKLSVPQVTIESKKTNITSPKASSYGKRMEAIGLLVDAGFKTSLRLDPIIPFWLSMQDIHSIIEESANKGIKHVTISVIKLKKRQFKSIGKLFGQKLIKNMQDFDGEWFVLDHIRLLIHESVKEKCNELGLTFGACRENVVEDSGYCDPFHLISCPKFKDIKTLESFL